MDCSIIIRYSEFFRYFQIFWGKEIASCNGPQGRYSIVWHFGVDCDGGCYWDFELFLE